MMSFSPAANFHRHCQAHSLSAPTPPPPKNLRVAHETTPTTKPEMFRRALFQQTRQFSRGIITPGPSLVRSSVRQWQVAPSLVRVRRTMSTESKPAEEAASSEPKPKGNNNSGDAKPSAEPKQDALQKELEKKTEEARDFKVPHHPTTPHPPPTPPSSSTHTPHVGQIHTHRRRLP